MSYHIEVPHSGFKELPDRILVREDGYLGAYKFYGEPIVDYWYVPEQRVTDTEREALTRRIDELCAEVERLHADQAHWELGNCPSCPNVVSLQEALEQNARLRELADGAMNEADRLTHDAAALQIENAKLRMLVDELYPLADYGAIDASELDRAHDLMRELGIEAPA